MLSSLRNCGVRSAVHCVGATLLAAMLAVFAPGGIALAEGECATAFERWSKLSASRMRQQNADSGEQEACLPDAAVRADLLQGLAKARSTCDAATWLDQSVKQTKEMIDINANFIGSVAVCRPERLPEPRPPEPVTAEPVTPKPVPPQRPRVRACLDVQQASPERYVLANRKCNGSKVLAVIEKQNPSGKVDCKAYTIERRLTLATLKDARPQINYECVLEQGGNCTAAHLATMFPECDW